MTREQIAEQIAARIREGGHYHLACNFIKARVTGATWSFRFRETAHSPWAVAGTETRLMRLTSQNCHTEDTMASRNTGPGKPASDVTKIDPKTGKRVLMGLVNAMPANASSRSSGGIQVTLTTEQRTMLEDMCAPTGGSRRDWAALAEVIDDLTKSQFASLPIIEVARDGLSAYQQYCVALGHINSSIHLGTGPTIAGIRTPAHTGTGYDRDRRAVQQGLAANGIVRMEAPTQKSGYTGPWLDAETKKPVRLVLVNAADMEQPADENAE